MKINFDSLLSINKLLQESFLQMFTGVKIKEDKELVGNDYYVAVSSSLLAEIEKK
jgi:hypothetical protein